jgi:lipopolysaccharide heptosyltransferase II
VNYKKICVIHLNQVGDLVFSLPLLKALRENYPDSEIHSIVKPYLRELITNFPCVDQIIIRNSGLKEKLKLLQRVRQNGYDLLISLSDSEECLFLTALSKARIKVGFSHFPWDFSLNIRERVEGHHGWYNNLKLLTRLGLNVEKRDYVGLLVPPALGKDGRELVESQGFSFQGKYVIISPGTSMRRRVKEWEGEKFAELIILLKANYDLTPVLVGGKDNRELSKTIVNIVKERENGESIDIVDLTGKVELRDLCFFIKNASLFVGIDSGVMHLASSMDVPVVALFGPSDPFYVGPQNERSLVVREEEMTCVPCYLKGCKDRTCMKELDVTKVLHACEKLLNRSDTGLAQISSHSPEEV